MAAEQQQPEDGEGVLRSKHQNRDGHTGEPVAVVVKQPPRGRQQQEGEGGVLTTRRPYEDRVGGDTRAEHRREPAVDEGDHRPDECERRNERPDHEHGVDHIGEAVWHRGECRVGGRDVGCVGKHYESVLVAEEMLLCRGLGRRVVELVDVTVGDDRAGRVERGKVTPDPSAGGVRAVAGHDHDHEGHGHGAEEQPRVEGQPSGPVRVE